jgi:mono/diheme cytochrome c family protein
LRSLPPVRNQVPANAIPPPAKAMMPPLPPAPEHVAPRDQSSAVKRGEYLATIGTCTDCHTPVDEHGAPIRDLIFAGGRELKGPWGDVAGANITPDASGISYYDEKQFIRVIRTGHVGARKLNNIMLWPNYARMTDSDLKDLFAYLRSLPPVHHRVDNSLPPTYCRICKGRHGGGDQN